MFQRTGLCLLLLVLVLVACNSSEPMPTPGPPPVSVTDVPYAGQDEFIGVVVDSVTPLRRGESSPNEQIEFRLVIIGTDVEGRSGGVFCPGAQPLLLNVGDTVEQPCATLMAFDTAAVGDKFYLLILAVDEDDMSLAADLGIDVGMQVLTFKLANLVSKSRFGAPGAGAAGIVALIAVEAADLFAGRAIEYFQRNDLIAQQGLVLFRSNGWGAGHDVSFRTQDGGMDVRLHVVRAAAAGQSGPVASLPAPGETQVLPREPAAPPTVASPTAAPPTPLPQFIDRLVLFNPTQGDVMTLRDGATVDLAAIGSRFLDIRAEVNSSQVGSVFFTLDGDPFCPHGPCVENVAPHIMGGDLNGEPYGDWEWSPLRGRTHTIVAVACTQANGGQPCAAPVMVRVEVR